MKEQWHGPFLTWRKPSSEPVGPSKTGERKLAVVAAAHKVDCQQIKNPTANVCEKERLSRLSATTIVSFI